MLVNLLKSISLCQYSFIQDIKKQPYFRRWVLNYVDNGVWKNPREATRLSSLRGLVGVMLSVCVLKCISVEVQAWRDAIFLCVVSVCASPG